MKVNWEAVEENVLTTRVLCDTRPPMPPDCIYIHGHKRPNTIATFDAAAVLAEEYPETIIAVAIHPPGEKNVLTFSQKKKSLIMRGVSAKRIIGLSSKSSPVPPSTDHEAYSLMEQAKKEGWLHVIIVSCPFHQVRAYFSVISAAIKLKMSPFRIWNQTSNPEPWRELAWNTNSNSEATRAEELFSEYRKRERYRKCGDHVSRKKVIETLNKRDFLAQQYLHLVKTGQVGEEDIMRARRIVKTL